MRFLRLAAAALAVPFTLVLADVMDDVEKLKVPCRTLCGVKHGTKGKTNICYLVVHGYDSQPKNLEPSLAVCPTDGTLCANFALKATNTICIALAKHKGEKDGAYGRLGGETILY